MTTPSADPPPAAAERLGRALTARSARVGIIGLGYVGLPLGLAFAEAGFPVLGFDIDARKVEALTAGRSYIDHLGAERVARQVEAGGFEATCDFDRLGEADAILICVPTPLGAHREPNLSYVEATARQIAPRLRSGHLVILESTTYPGTTDELLRPLLEAEAAPRGLTFGREIFLAFSPEREDPGNPSFGTTQIPKVVGGLDPVSGDLAEQLYAGVIDQVVRVSSPRVAEASKLTENIFRAVNIALVNELKTVYDAMGIDVWEVLDAAATKPFGFMRFTPGPGWGGHCIPVDPFYLTWKATEYGRRARFIELAGEVNVEMPRWVLGKLQTALNDAGKPLRGSKILVVGLAYKRDIADPRESPAFEILDLLLEHGADVSYHDPHIPEAPAMRTWPDLPPLRSVPLDESVVVAQDAVVIVTDHSSVDYAALARSARLVVDTRGMYRDGGDNIVRA
ncbi:MAG: nucleotide sugar dehydrogenase [Acidobacteriota bacterium]